MKKALKVICLIGWMALIFYFSAQNVADSKHLSEGVLSFLAKALSENEFYRILIRKMAHFFLYFVLGLLAYVNFKKTGFSVIFCALYALSDEIHQYFVPGRSFMAADILLDSVASALAVVIMFKIYAYHRMKE